MIYTYHFQIIFNPVWSERRLYNIFWGLFIVFSQFWIPEFKYFYEIFLSVMVKILKKLVQGTRTPK